MSQALILDAGYMSFNKAKISALWSLDSSAHRKYSIQSLLH